MPGGAVWPGGPGLPPHGGWPGIPPAPGRHPGAPDRHRGRRLRRGLAVGIVAAVIGASGTFLALRHSDAGTAGTVLTTAQVASKVDPALVDINTVLGYQQEAAAGTGLVLTSSGEVLTNNHVIEGATRIQVTDIGNGQTYRAKVVGYDRSEDIAVLKLEGASGLQTVTLGSSSTAKVGQKVVAIGNAGGQGGTPSVVTGRILALNASVTATDASAGTSERLTGLIKHNAPIQPGDSGGPLVNTAGQVIGIDTAASTSDFQFQGGTSQTQGFAIPVNEALSVARQIEAGTSSSSVHIGATGFVGVDVASPQQAQAMGVPANAGALVAGTLPGSPAAQAGLSAGDLITAVDGRHVSSALALQAALQQHHPGDSVAIGWTGQNGQRHTTNVTLTSGPAG